MKKLLLILIIPTFLMSFSLEDRINNESNSHNKRIKMLQEADQCINEAKTIGEYKACEKEENQTRKKYKEENFEQIKANILKRINNAISRNLEQNRQLFEVKSCVKQSITKEDLDVCKEKFSRKNKKFKNKEQ